MNDRLTKAFLIICYIIMAMAFGIVGIAIGFALIPPLGPSANGIWAGIFFCIGMSAFFTLFWVVTGRDALFPFG